MNFRSIILFMFLLMCLSATTLVTSCSRKSGCPGVENATNKTDKYGRLQATKPKSGLLPKKAVKKKTR